jgi:hypothetical protein
LPDAPIVCVHERAATLPEYLRAPHGFGELSQQEVRMKWAGMYLVGFIILIGGVLAALWKLGILENIGTTWTVIGVVILIGLGVMFSVANSGAKENIQIDRK